MKRWLPIILLFSASCFAQLEGGNNALNIPPLVSPKPNTTTAVPPKADPYFVPPSIKGEPTKNYNLDLDKKINFGAPKPKFDNPGDEIANKINNEGNNGKTYAELRMNKHIGEFRVKSSLVTIYYQDVGNLIDGEYISVFINDRFVRDIAMERDRRSIDIPLDKGFNKVALKVSNVGSVWPSTMYWEVRDDNGKVLASDTWFADIGIVSDMVIFKE